MVAAFRSFTKLLLLYYVLSSFVNTHYSIFIFMFMVDLKASRSQMNLCYLGSSLSIRVSTMYSTIVLVLLLKRFR